MNNNYVNDLRNNLAAPIRGSRAGREETLLDLWARWGAWLDKYVKHPQKPEPRKTTTDQPVAAVR